jgi:hypothetical protein
MSSSRAVFSPSGVLPDRRRVVSWPRPSGCGGLAGARSRDGGYRRRRSQDRRRRRGPAFEPRGRLDPEERRRPCRLGLPDGARERARADPLGDARRLARLRLRRGPDGAGAARPCRSPRCLPGRGAVRSSRSSASSARMSRVLSRDPQRPVAAGPALALPAAPGRRLRSRQAVGSQPTRPSEAFRHPSVEAPRRADRGAPRSPFNGRREHPRRGAPALAGGEYGRGRSLRPLADHDTGRADGGHPRGRGAPGPPSSPRASWATRCCREPRDDEADAPRRSSRSIRSPGTTWRRAKRTST